ncbi:MAG TPA: pseudouridine synthase [Azoarcus taiwanensis]|nr:pseudouridine synthase [Azoarcus taiwanensis]
MLDILYRDEHLVAIHKPSGLLVHRSQLDRHETRFAVQLLRDQIGRHVHPVHRLDKGTSGALVFALDRETAGRLSKTFGTREVMKRYLAVVRGFMPAEEGIIDHPLSRQRDDAEGAPAEASDTARDAITRFCQLATTELPHRVDRYPTSRYALVALEPETGRRHQLRRHLKHVAHPIIGDATHGKGRHNRLFAEHYGCARLLLACTRLSFTHPWHEETVDIHCPPSEDFGALITALGWAEAAKQACV